MPETLMGRTVVLSCAIMLGAPYSVKADTDAVPKDVATYAIHHFLAQRLSEECNSLRVNSNTALHGLRRVLNKHEGMRLSQNTFPLLERRLGEGLLFAAEQVYFRQMKVDAFDPASACRAGERAIEEAQEVGKLLKSGQYHVRPHTHE